MLRRTGHRVIFGVGSLSCSYEPALPAFVFSPTVFSNTLLDQRCSFVCRCTRHLREPAHNDGRGGYHFRPFSADDEAQLMAVLTTKPRHVARHIRQSMLHSRRRVAQFRNSVTYLMILLQARLQKSEIKPDDASVLVESLMKECVDLRQGDMAHLLFRAVIRFRKYGLTVRFPLVRYLYDSYRSEQATDLMVNMADEFRNDPSLRFLAVLAYLFANQHETAMSLLREIPVPQLRTDDYCALLEGLGMAAKYDTIMDITVDILQNKDVRTDVNRDRVFSSAIMSIRGNMDLLQDMVLLAQKNHAALDEQALGTLMRARLQTASISCVADVYDVEAGLREELRLPTLGVSAETAVISKCSEVMTRNNEHGDHVMLQKVKHLKGVIETAIENDQVDDIELSYQLAVVKGFGVLGQFEEMRDCFQKLRDAGAVKDHRLYDEMLRWYAHAHNLKEAIALKEDMTKRNIFHTPQTYQYLFRVLDKYYPRIMEKYLAEMRSKGIQIESFMYPTLIRIFSELHDYHTVDNLYREAKNKAAQGNVSMLSPAVIVQMLKAYQHDPAQCESVIQDIEHFGLFSSEVVQAQVVQCYSSNDRQECLQAFVSRVPHKSPDLYRVLLRDSAKRKDSKTFAILLKEMQESGVQLNERLYSVIVTAQAHFNNAAGVREYVQRAMSSNQIRTPLFFGDAAAAFARLGDTQAVDRCWEDLLASKMVITMPVYNRFLDLYMGSNNMNMVQSILDTMMKLVPPNPVTATTVVDMLGKMGRFSDMEAILDEMSHSTNAAPTLVTFHQAMNAYAKCGDVTKMEAVRERLKREGFQENHVTFNILFEGYGRAKRYEQLPELMEERKRKNIPLEEFGYVVLLNTFARARMTVETEALVEDMVKSGIDFSARMLATIATSFSFVGDIPKMEHYISLLLSHPDCRIRDVESVYMIYSRMRQTVKLQELLDAEQLPKSEFIYNICVGAFAKAGEHTKVAYLLSQMESMGYTLSRSTSVTLSSLLLKAGKLELAQIVLKWKGLNLEEVSVPSEPPSDEEDEERLRGELREKKVPSVN